jgi:3-hydroxyacyl-[acyl-carrier-protein] dehydratase
MPEEIETKSFNVVEIMRFQQNRFPMLFIDKVWDVIPGKFARGTKCFTYNEWFFPSHFPEDPNVPGFVQVECLVQVFIMTFLSDEKYRGLQTSFVSIDNFKFKRKIVPGDVLIITAELDFFNRGIAKGKVRSDVNGEEAASGNLVVAIPSILNQFKPKAEINVSD